MDSTSSDNPKTQNTSYTSALNSCKDMVETQLITLLGEMFNNAENAFLDFVDKAETNQSQFQFIDAINVIANCQPEVEQGFREQIARGFEEFSQGNEISYPSPVMEKQKDDTMALVEDGDLDKFLAFQTMIERSHSRTYETLYALRQRLGVIHGGKPLEYQDIPAGPAHIASSFRIAAEAFGLEINVELIIYALFDKYVMKGCDALYDEYNNLLSDAGIFPNLKFTAPKNPDSPDQGSEFPDYEESGELPQPHHQKPVDTTDNAGLGDELFSSIRDLMASRRRHDPDFAQHPDFNPAADRSHMVESPQLASAISEIQPQQRADFLPDTSGGIQPTNIEIDTALLEEIRETLNEERRKLFKNIDRNTIPSADLDTIELVGMLFEHVLNESQLPNVAKALLSHLHTPYLKVAIMDHHFLVDSKHPARRLLNLMVEAGRDWIEEEDLRRGIYYPMQEVVDRILSEFKDDISLFDELINHLSTKADELEKKAKVVEARSQEAAKGRERLENSRAKAQSVVKERINNRSLHPVILRFLNHAWLDRMILLILRDPKIEESVEWKEVIQIIDATIWACVAREKPELREKLKQTLPTLRRKIESGLSATGQYHQSDVQALFELLSTTYTEQPIASVTPITAATPKRPSEPVNEQPEPEAASKEFTKRTPEPEPAREPTPKEKAMIKALRNVEFGTWFELSDSTKNEKMGRLKLSWFSPVTQKYMFVDITGVQAQVIPINALAEMMCNGNARIADADTKPFVDRAMTTIRSLLEKTFGI
ncbi:MAG: DUF1631 domain-containing protein [Gammaproteobacteria bacterium]|nr:DUF1631 domain-containing protein [Gammaproteobacteria bacterium]